MKRPNRTTNRWVVLAVCCTALFIVGIDVSGLNLALPSIQKSLHTTSSELQWITDAYSIVLASMLMMSGSLGDRWGRKRIFMLGLVLFGAGSILCAFATTPGFLIVSRGVQAIGGSMLTPVAMAIITNTFLDPGERAQAIGFWGTSIGLSNALGPLIGGVLVERIGWQAIFWINVPIVAAALALTAWQVPESRAEDPRRFDPAGQILVMIALGALTYGIIEGRVAGWTSTEVIACFVVAALAALLMVLVEFRISEPMLDPRFFSSRPFTGAVLAAVLGFTQMGGFLFINTLYLQDVRGYTPIVAGLVGLPMALSLGLLSPVSGRLVATRGPRLPMVLAGSLEVAAGLILVFLRADTPLLLLFVAYALLGAGQGILNAPITNSAVSGMPRAQAGVAAAVASSARQVGTTLGIAVYGTVVFGAIGSDLSRIPDASHPAWAITIACGSAIVLLGSLTAGRSARSKVDEEEVSEAIADASQSPAPIDEGGAARSADAD